MGVYQDQYYLDDFDYAGYEKIKMENRNQVVATETQDAYRGTRKMNPKLREDVKAHPENYTFSNH